ncbi:MAG: hypothetical protein HC831_24155 [Chloroflexia bacterium]|nr:hypothetical protein [Chloroflexia bacterium]
MDSDSNPFELSEPTQVTKQDDDFYQAKFSPDGNKLLATKKGYQGIYIIDLENKNLVTEVTDEEKAGFEAKWAQNGETIKYQSRKQTSISKTFNYNLKSKSHSLAVSTFKSVATGIDDQQELSVKYNLKRRMVEASYGEKTWDITKEQGSYYDFVISPDKTKVLIHKNDGRMYIYALDGSGLLYCLGNGLCQSWTPDGKYLVYFISYDNGYYTTESDIYLSKVDGSKKWRLTNTEDKIEKWPHLSEDGSKLTFYDMTSDRIYISNLSKKK